MDLRYWLEQKEPDLHRAVVNIRAAVEPLLERPLHRDYTDHSIKHSERIIEKLDDLTEGLMKSDVPLSPTEVYILLAAVYLHDLGMQDERYTTNKEWIRKHHHELTRNIIFQSLEQRNGRAISLNLDRTPGIADVVAWVAEAHRETDLYQDRYDSFWHGERNIRPRLLAALLRLADELDIDYRRAPMEMLTLREISPESRFHWYKCYYVSGVQIENEYVTVWYQFPQGCEDYERLITRLVDSKIQLEFSGVKGIFRHHGVKVGIGHSKVRYVPHLEPMPPEVKEFALERTLEWHEELINQEMEQISFLESFRS